MDWGLGALGNDAASSSRAGKARPRAPGHADALSPRQVEELLFDACSHGHPRLAVRYAKLARRGARNLMGFGSLALAAHHGHANVVKALLASQDPRAIDDFGLTPLMQAARDGELECLEALLPHSDPRAVDHRGMNALMHASAMGREQCARLISQTCDQDAQDFQGRTALMWAAHQCRSECVEILAGGCGTSHVCSKGWSALMYAVKNMHRQLQNPQSRELRCVEALLANGHCDVPDADERTAAEEAAKAGAHELADRIKARSYALSERDGFLAMLPEQAAPRRARAL